MSNLESRTSGAEISGDLPTTITDQIDGIIFELPFDDKIKLWGLIDKLVLENKTEVSDEDIEKAMWEHFSDEWYREQLKKNKTMTALEFFYEQIIDSIGTNPKIDNLFEQAKEMEAEQQEQIAIDFAEWMLDYDPTVLYQKTKKELFQEFLKTKQ